MRDLRFGWVRLNVLLAGLILFLFSELAGATPIILRGQRVDVLVEPEKGVCRIGTQDFSFVAENLRAGWVVCVDRRLFVVNRQAIVNVHTGETVSLPEPTLLPDVRSAVSGQWMVRENTIFLPVSSGMRMINPVSGRSDTCLFSHHLKIEDGIRLDVARVIRTDKQLFLWQEGVLSVAAENEWKPLSRMIPTGILEEHFLDSLAWAWLVRFRVDQGDLDSFRIEARPLNTHSAVWQDETVQEGLLRNLFMDDKGRLILEYMDASIMAAIFHAKKVNMRAVDPSGNLDTHHTFSVSHKRRHLFAVPRPDGSILVLIQCKDGNCYLADPVSGRFSRLEKQFDYEFTFLRGESSGIFYQTDTGAFHPVELQLPPER